MRILAIPALLIGTAAIPALAQIDRPGALDAVHACNGLTCVWTADSTSHAHSGPYEVFLDPKKGSNPNADDVPTNLVVTRKHVTLLRTLLKNLSASVTVTWSPDRSALAVSWSDGGAIGNFHTRVFHLDGDHFAELSAITTAFNQFKARHNCATRGDNVQAYRFDQNSHSLMLVLSVYPTGDCGKQIGFTQGYLVSIANGAVLQRYSKHQLTAYMRAHPEGT